MTVKELISKLQRLNQDLHVFVTSPDSPEDAREIIAVDGEVEHFRFDNDTVVIIDSRLTRD